MDPLSIVASTLAIIQGISLAYTAIQDIKGLPKTFHRVNQSLPVAQNALEALGNNLDESSKRTNAPVIEACQENAKALLEIFEEVNNSRKGKGFVLRFGKAHQVEKLMEEMLQSLKLLSIEQSSKAPTLARISKLLKEEISGLLLGAHHEDPRRVAILNTLLPLSYLERKDRNPDRVPGTCQWFVDHQRFRQWRESTSSSMLWVSADPGCGKSVLAKHLVDSELPTTTSRTTTYFFFKDDFEDQRSAKNAIRCILHQLFTQNEALFSSEIVKRFESRAVLLADSFKELWEVLLLVSRNSNAGEIVCILDAFDECEDREQAILAQAICQLYGTAGTNTFNLKVLITSRPHGDIRKGFQPLDIPGLPVVHLSGESEVEMDKIAQEIDVYIKARVSRICCTLKLKSDEEELLLQSVMRIPNRTYLWVYLTLNLIQSDVNINKKAAIRNAVSCLPSTVDDAYESILSRSANPKEARKLLHIVVAAVRPLTLAEMAIALALQEKHRSYHDLDLDLELPVDDDDFGERFSEHIRDLCGLFITIIGSKVYLLHQTAREFLVPDDPSKIHDNGALWKFSLQPQESHRILSRICVWHLLFSEFETYPLDDSIHQCVLYHVFLDYSAKNWAFHSRAAGVVDDSMTKSMLAICDAQTVRCQAWFRIFWTASWYPRGLTSLMIASYVGLESVVRMLLKGRNVEINSIDAIYRRSALSWASEHGYDGVVELLIEGLKGPKFSPRRHLRRLGWKDKKYQLDTKDHYGRTPLSYAAWNGHAAIVKQLVRAGASVNTPDEIGLTPVSYALCNGDEAVVSQLVKDSPTQSVDKTREKLLLSAAEKNRDDIVKQLLDNGTNVEAVDKYGYTPLHKACRNGCQSTVRLLFDYGGNIEAVDKWGKTPLLIASYHEHPSIVRFLLDKGANIEAVDNTGSTPLSEAIASRSEGVVQYLLDYGANIDEYLKRPAGWPSLTPLFSAVYSGDEVILRLLVEKGANIEAVEDGSGWTPLFGAANDGLEGIVKLLLDKGANPAVVDKKDETALDVAVKMKNEGIVRLLRDDYDAPFGHQVAGPRWE